MAAKAASAPAEPVPLPTPTEQAEAIWDTWEPKRAEVHQGRPTKRMPKTYRMAMVARIREHSRDDVVTVIAWWLGSDHERAQFLRSRQIGWKSILRPGNFAEYLSMSSSVVPTPDPRARGRPDPVADLTDFDAIRDEIHDEITTYNQRRGA